jgi:hypothetical protein
MTCSGHCICGDFRELYSIALFLHAIIAIHFHPDGDAQAIRMFFRPEPTTFLPCEILQKMTQVVARHECLGYDDR